MVKLRRVEPTSAHRLWPWRAADHYELSLPSPDGQGDEVVRLRQPWLRLVSMIGSRKTWALVHAADQAWLERPGDWVSLDDLDL